MKLHVGESQRIHFFQPGILLFVSCRGSFLHLPCCMILLDLFIQHQIIKEPTASKCFCQKLFLFFIWINAKLIRFIHASFHPDSQYIGESFQSELLLLSKGRSSDSKMPLSKVFPEFPDTPSSTICCLHFYMH